MSSDFSTHDLIWDLPILWFTHGIPFERPWIGAEQGRWNYTKMWDTWCLAPAWAPRERWHINCTREFVLPKDKRVRLLNFWTPGNQNPLDGEQDGFNHWKVVTQRRLQIWTINWRTYSNWKISILTKLAKGTLGYQGPPHPHPHAPNSFNSHLSRYDRYIMFYVSAEFGWPQYLVTCFLWWNGKKDSIISWTWYSVSSFWNLSSRLGFSLLPPL